jgi:16S rRNA (uracil1498-N3)-methyltransferase
MPAERYFTNMLSPSSEEFVITGDEFHHVIRVMRTREGDTSEFVNGKGTLAVAKLVSIGKQKAVFAVESLITETPPKRQLVLVQGMPKLQRLEFIAEKGTELGMTSLWLFPGDHSEKEGLSANQKDRLQAILIASMKQCGSLFLPTLEVKPKLASWKEFPTHSYFGDVNPQATSFTKVLKQQAEESLYFFVGPEAGFSEKETEAMKRGGVAGVHLHKNILRTDTAGIVALAIATSI